MLWTIVPLNFVIDGSESYRPEYMEIRKDNTILIVEEMNRNTAKVVRVISSDPNDYLNPALQPGCIIQLNKEETGSMH